MRKPRIDIWTIQHKGINGGGTWKLLKSFPQGPRGTFQAEKFRQMEHEDNIRCYGTIGCGRTAAFVGDVEITKALNQEYTRAVEYGRKSLAIGGGSLVYTQKEYDRVSEEIQAENNREWEEYVNSGQAEADAQKTDELSEY